MSVRHLWRDNRAIEGLPIRLVIALVVGVACLSVMMTVIDGMDTFESTELETDPEPEVIHEEETEVTVTVTDSDGNTIAGATVIAEGETASLPEIATAETDEDGTATLSLDPTLPQNRDRGEISLDIRPPSGDYTDDRENTGILVLDSYSSH